MRKTIRKKYDLEISKNIIYVSILFIIFVVIGTYLNKIFFNGQDIILDSITYLSDYYGKAESINIKDIAFCNLKENISFLSSIVLYSLFAITFPLAIGIFLLKALSVGYTINSFILVMKFRSIKMILLIIMKNFIIIPGAILIMVMSFYYIKSIYREYKNKSKEGIIFFVKRYLLNGFIIVTACVFLQLLINIIVIAVLWFLAI